MSEVLRHLVETGAIGQDAEGHWVAQDSLEVTALPDSVRQVIGARVLRLGKEAGRVLSVASVIGRDFDLELLARATQTDQDDLLDLLDAAAVVALVREVADTGRYAFAHALIQRTLYEDLGPNRRARAHRQVAEALEALCGNRPGARVSELARHWVAAPSPSTSKRPSRTRTRPVTPPWPRLPPPTPCATTPRPSTSTPSSVTPIRHWGSTWPSGSARPSARPATPPFGAPSSTPRGGRPTSMTPSGWWRPRWPTTAAG